MVAAATAILKDIDLSNTSLDRLVRRSNLASPDITGWYPIKYSPRPFTGRFTSEGEADFSASKKENVRNKVNDLKTTLPDETSASLSPRMTMT
jgi:hypothetical protein